MKSLPMVTSLMTIRESSLSFQSLYDGTALVREYLLFSIENLASEGNNMIIVEGGSGVGKTTLLLQFAKANHSNSFVYFINPACKVTFSQDFFLEDIGRQVFFYITGSAADENIKFNEHTFNDLILSLIKTHNKKGERLYFIIDGLDQIDKADQSILLQVLSYLPFNSNNFCFLVSGEVNSINELLPNQYKRRYKSILVPFFSIEESIKLFECKSQIEKDSVKEIHSIWKGHPDVLSQIRRIINNGTSLEALLLTDISGINDLLEVEWKQMGFDQLAFDSLPCKLTCILAFSDGTRKIEDLELILGLEDEVLPGLLPALSFLQFRNNEIDFISNSFRNFVKKKLLKYKNQTLAFLVEYYLGRGGDKSALVNLPQLYDERKDYGAIIKLLDFENLSIILNNSQSLGEIKRHVNLGYKASTTVSKAYDELFRFSLYRSTLLGIQTSDRRESQMEAYVRLNKIKEAESIITGTILKEDKFRMYVKFLRELKVSTDHSIEQRHLDEVNELFKNCDEGYLKSNLIDIALDLAHFSPELAISTVESVSGLKSGNSIEWVLGYIAFVTQKGLDLSDDSEKYPVKKNDELESFVEKFSESIGFSVKKISGYEVINEVEKAKTANDKIFRIKEWIKEHPDDENIHNIIEYALDLLIENSSQIKPTATTVYEVIGAIGSVKEERYLRVLVSKIENLLLTANTPTIDKYRVEFAVIYSVFQYDESESSEKAFHIVDSISSIMDNSVKLEVLCHCYDLIKKVHNELTPGKTFMFTTEEMKVDIVTTFNNFLIHVAEQYDELKDILKTMSVIDFELSLQMAKGLNIQYRRLQAIRQCIVSHCKLPIKSWDIERIEVYIKELMVDPIVYTTTLLRLVKLVYRKSDMLDNSDRIKFANIVKLIEAVPGDPARCTLLTQSIVILSGVSSKDGEAKISFSRALSVMKNSLRTSWNRLTVGAGRIGIGYDISSMLSDADRALAEEYLENAEILANSEIMDNASQIGAYVESIRLCIRIYGGILRKDRNVDYSRIKSQIQQVPSIRDQILLWSDLSVKCYEAGDTSRSNEIVQLNIVPVIEKHRNASSIEYYYFLLRTAASAIQLSQPETLRQFISVLNSVQIDEIIVHSTFSVLSKKFDSEPYSGSVWNGNVTYQELINYIHLLNLVSADYAIFISIHKITDYLRKNPNSLVREQKIEIGSRLAELYTKKIPNHATGIRHDGYLILCKAICYYYVLNPSVTDVVKFFEGLENEALKITNIPDRVFTLSWLSTECIHSSSNSKKKQMELMNRSFDEAKNINCLSERMTTYLELLERSSKINSDFFRERYSEILQDLYKLDEKDIFPTSRSFIDLAFKFDKHLAQRWVDALDGDPARKILADPTKNRHEQLEMEAKVMSDYKLFGSIKDRDRMARIAWMMLGELNAGKRNSRTIDKVVNLVHTSSKNPLFDAIPAFSFFIENVIKDDETSNGLLNSLYNSACSNVEFCYALIGSINSRRINPSYSLVESNDSLIVKPGMRIEAIQFIKQHVKNCETKDIIIVDQYFSAKDVEFIKDLNSCLFDAKITILTSVNSENKELSREVFSDAWKGVSSENIPEITVIKAVVGNRSPFHDRWIIFNDKQTGILMGTSINSLGNQISNLKYLQNEIENRQIYNEVINPFVNEKVKIFANQQVKYEIFDM